MEVKDFENLSCVHDHGNIINMFTTPEEALELAEKIRKKTEFKLFGKVVIPGKKLSCDPLYNVLGIIQREAELKGLVDARRAYEP